MLPKDTPESLSQEEQASWAGTPAVPSLVYALEHLSTAARIAESMRLSGRLEDALELCDVALDEHESIYGTDFPPAQVLLFEMANIYEALNCPNEAHEFRSRALSMLERLK